MLQWSLSATVAHRPEQLFEHGVSDHAPAQVCFAHRDRKPLEGQPAQAFVCQQPEFKRYLDVLFQHSFIKKLPAVAKWQDHERLL